MVHKNSPLTPEGRRRLCERVDAGRPIAHVAAEGGVSRQTLDKWYKRWLLAGEEGLTDVSSRPDRSPNAIPLELERVDVKEFESQPSLFEDLDDDDDGDRLP